MIEWAASSDPEVLRLLQKHPRILTVGRCAVAGVEFRQGGRLRAVRVGDADTEFFGLVELMDNNPLVCADVASVPSPAATLALIALGPLARAGLIADNPVVILSIEGDERDIFPFLAAEGWEDGISLHIERQDLDGVGAAAVMASIGTPERRADIQEIYDERFGRSFFIRRDEESPWSPELVRGTPYAYYRLSLAPDSPNSLLTVRVLGSTTGKLGAAQVVHCMNVMCGFEESLGIGF